MSRYCRDCCHARVIGERPGEVLVTCALGHWGPESWPVALIAPSCDDFELAAEGPDPLDFWGLQPGYGLEPEPRRYGKAQTTPLGVLCEAKQ